MPDPTPPALSVVPEPADEEIFSVEVSRKAGAGEARVRFPWKRAVLVAGSLTTLVGGIAGAVKLLTPAPHAAAPVVESPVATSGASSSPGARDMHRVERRVDALDERQGKTDSAVAATAATLSALRDQVGSMQTDVRAMQSAIGSVQAGVAGLDGKLGLLLAAQPPAIAPPVTVPTVTVRPPRRGR